MEKNNQTAEEVREILEEYILKQNFSAHTTLPSERELSTLLNVNRATLRKAIGLLTNEHKIYTEEGKNFISPSKFIENASEFISTTTGWEAEGHSVRSDILSFSVIEANLKLAQIFGVRLGSSLYELKRLRYIDETPAFIEKSYIPYEYCPNLVNYEFKENTSLYKALYELSSIEITSQQQTIKITQLTDEEYNLLEQPISRNAFYSTAIGCDDKNTIIEYSIFIARSDVYAIKYIAGYQD